MCAGHCLYAHVFSTGRLVDDWLLYPFLVLPWFFRATVFCIFVSIYRSAMICSHYGDINSVVTHLYFQLATTAANKCGRSLK